MQRRVYQSQDVAKTLLVQVEEKRKRENDERDRMNEQARIWKQQEKNENEEERRMAEKIKVMNAENCNFVKKQIDKKQTLQ